MDADTRRSRGLKALSWLTVSLITLAGALWLLTPPPAPSSGGRTHPDSESHETISRNTRIPVPVPVDSVAPPRSDRPVGEVLHQMERHFAREMPLPHRDGEPETIPNAVKRQLQDSRAVRLVGETRGTVPGFAVHSVGFQQFYPARYSAAMTLEIAEAGVGIKPAWEAEGTAQTVDGAIIYANVRPGVDVIRLAQPLASEEYILVQSAEALHEIRYDIALSREIRSVREINGFYEFRDGEGVPRIRLHPVTAMDADGRDVPIRMTVSGLTPGTPEPGNATIHHPAGQITATLTLAAIPDHFPILIDPGWSSTASRTDDSRDGSRVLLTDGRVLAVGGVFSTISEIYDPYSGTWTGRASTMENRYNSTLTVLPNGKVLCVGGSDIQGDTSYEIYNPATDSWRFVDNPLREHKDHTATLLTNGKVLIAGGTDTLFCELFDPETETMQATDSLKKGTERQNHTATLLRDGRVLVAGGYLSGTCEIYDPSISRWVDAATLSNTRYNHCAVLLSSGNVLVAAGSSGGATCEVFNPLPPPLGSWSGAALMNNSPNYFAMSLLQNGKVLAMGGNGSLEPSTEIYSANLWALAEPMTRPRTHHTATLLPNGRIFVTGTTSTTTSLTCEVYDTGIGGWQNTGNLTSAARSLATSTLLPNGNVVLVGGANASSASVVTCSQYDPAAQTWSPLPSLNDARQGHAATFLPTGKILVTGGLGAGNVPLPQCEIYDPSTQTWSRVAPMATARYNHTSTLLPSGHIVVIGGLPGLTRTVELYDPAANSWQTSTVQMVTGRSSHTATLLPNGRVLVTGGSGTGGVALTSCELFDPTGPAWTNAGTFTARTNHTATLMPDGKVLVAGGRSGVTATSGCQIYSPGSNTWSSGPALIGARYAHSATLLADGRLLIAGGTTTSALNTCELYDPMTVPTRWIAAKSLAFAHFNHTATLLLSGKLLIASGLPGPTEQCEVYDPFEGQTPAAWKPTISAINGSSQFPVTAGAGTTITLSSPYGWGDTTGTGFRGISEASGGFGHLQSATNYPVVVLRRIASGGSDDLMFLPVSRNWSDARSLQFTMPSTSEIPEGNYVIWVIVNGIYGDAKPILVSTAPALPTNLSQHDDPLTPAAAVGFTDDDTSMTFKGRVSDTAAEGGAGLPMVRLQVEIQPLGTAFTGTPTGEGPLVTSGTTAEVTLSGIQNKTSYHWQARAVDYLNTPSGWVSFPATPNAETVADFIISASEPPSVPTAIAQRDDPGGPNRAAPFTDDDNSITFAGTLSDPDTLDRVRLQVEAKPVGVAFDETALLESAEVANGASVEVTKPDFANRTAYHWRARAIDNRGQMSAWISFGSNADPGDPDFDIRANDPPNPPTSNLLQYDEPTSSAAAVGYIDDDVNFTFKAPVSDSDTADTLQLQVEVQPIGTNFSGNPTASSAVVSNGATAVVTLSLANHTRFHWQARTRDNKGATSAWITFGGNADPNGIDFEVQANTAPGAPTSLSQHDEPGSAAAIVGFVDDENSFTFKAIVGDPDPGDLVRLQIEVQPVGVSFTGTATTESATPVTSGSLITLTLNGLANNTSFHWQARGVDGAGLTSAWVSFPQPPNAETETDFRIDINNAPTAPAGLSQHDDPAGAARPVGFTDDDTSVTFKAAISDLDGNRVKLHVEAKPIGTAFANTPTVSSAFINSGTTAEVTTTFTDSTSYHWQAWVEDERGSISTRVAFGSNPESDRDFICDATAPTVPATITYSPNPNNTGAHAVQWTAATDAGSGVSNYDVRRSSDGGSTWATVASNVTAVTWTQSPALGEGLYLYQIRARDAAGNVGGFSTNVNTVRVDLTPPTTPTGVASSPSPNRTGAHSVTWNASTDPSGSGVASYSIRRSADGGSTWASAASGITVLNWTQAPALTQGTYIYQIAATDAVGNIGSWSSSSAAVVVDTTAPAVPSGVSYNPNPNSTGTHTVNWTPSTDTGGAAIAGYDIRRSPDGTNWTVVATNVASVSWAQSPAVSQGSYIYQVRALDTAGNTSAYSSNTNTVVVDSTAPDTRLDSYPTSPTQSLTATFTFSATKSPVTFQRRLDAGAWVATTSPETLTLTEGTHTFEVKAIDSTGNEDPTPASWTWTIDRTPPDTTLSANVTSPTTLTSVTFTFSSSEAGSTFLKRLDGGTWSSASSPDMLSGLLEGTHTYDVKAIDPAGNEDPTPASFTWIIDRSVPDTALSANITSPTNSTGITFTFTATEPNSTFRRRIDAGAWSVAVSPDSLSSLPEGSHTYEVKAVDSSGNEDPSPASFTWVIDATPPTLPTGIAYTSTPNNTGTHRITWTASTDSSSGISSYDIQRQDGSGLWTTIATTLTTTDWTQTPALGEGTYVYQIRARDTAGNVSGWSTNTNSVLIDTTAPTAPASVAYDPNPNNTGTFTVSWPAGSDALSGVATYDLRRTADGSTWTTVATAIAGTNWTQVPALTQGSYIFQVRTVDRAGNAGAFSTNVNPVNIIMDTTPPDTTAATVNDGLFADIDWQVSRTSIAANWSGFTDPETPILGYRWAIGTTRGGEEVRAFMFVGDVPAAYATMTLIEGTTYYVTVEAINDVGLTSRISSDGVTVDSLPPAAPTLLEPENAATLGSATGIRFDWSDVSDAVSYRIQIDTDNTFAAPLMLDLSVSGSEFNAGNLQPGAYFWRVQAVDISQNISAWSAPFSFTVTGASRLTVQVGPASPTAAAEINTAQNVSIAQLRFTAGPLEGVQINTLTITAQGTADDQANIARITLYHDVNSNGLFDSLDAPLASPQSYLADNRSVTFDDLAQVVPASESRDFIVVYDLNGTADIGTTFRARVAMDTHVNASGIDSGVTILPVGNFPVSSDDTTIVSSQQPGALTISQGYASPPDAYAAPNEQSVEMLQLQLHTSSVEAVRITGLELHPQGTGDDAVHLSGVYLVEDLNANGIYNAGSDRVIASQTFSADGAPVVFSINETIGAGVTVFWLAVYDFNGSGQIGATFQSRISTSFAGFAAAGLTSGSAITPPAADMPGAVMTIGATGNPGALTISALPLDPAAGVLPFTRNVPALRFQLSAGGLEEIVVSQLRILCSGSGNESVEVDRLKLWQDADGNDEFAASADSLIAEISSPFHHDGAESSFNSMTLGIPAGESRTWFVTIDFSSRSRGGSTFQLSFDVTSAPPPVVISGKISNTFMTPRGDLVVGPTIEVQPIPSSSGQSKKSTCSASGTLRPDGAIGFCLALILLMAAFRLRARERSATNRRAWILIPSTSLSSTSRRRASTPRRGIGL